MTLTKMVVMMMTIYLHAHLPFWEAGVLQDQMIQRGLLGDGNLGGGLFSAQQGRGGPLEFITGIRNV
jgi:hypothetical protein